MKRTCNGHTLSMLGMIGLMSLTLSAIPAFAAKADKEKKQEDAQRVIKGKHAECYDFSGLEVDHEYHVSDSITMKDAFITFKHFHNEKDTPSESEQQFAKVTNGMQARGTAPELRMYLINAEVTPNAPVKKVSLKFAEANHENKPDAMVNNIEVNGERHVVHGGMASMDGKIIGAEGGKAQIKVTINTPNDGGFNRGTLELHAKQGNIKNFAIGGLQFFIDDVCMKKAKKGE